jgi:hypothetical protein
MLAVLCCFDKHIKVIKSKLNIGFQHNNKQYPIVILE